MENITKEVDDFVADFSKQLFKLNPHDFIAKKQSAFLTKKKEELASGEFIVICDFAENYHCVVQVQAFALFFVIGC